ncbi:N-6 DNA methylase [Candidatus Woesearchaeota archaeon]|nr:N-6 DNA methylase [Candidatus Woesearchaeota archaeon]
MTQTKLTKEQAKESVKKLVDKYNRIVECGSIKRYKEEDTKAELIEPLFEALGWDVRNSKNDDEVVREEKISKGRVDYSFRIDGIPKFFLEAKALKEDLDNIKFVEQAVNYSWHKGCTWAVLTNFEAIKIFNAEWKSANPLQAQFGQTLPCQSFLKKFDTLWLLSRDSFENKLLDIEAEKWGKKIKKISVDKQLLSDLTRFRDLLNKNILKNNSSKNLSGDELDEAVQRIIDRLIFIRTLEDKELEAPMLQSVVREDLNKRIYKKLNLIFRKIDDIYNSKLFTPHLCEDLDIDDEVLGRLINGLFNTSDNVVHYDFSAIDADVLGNIYEQYLGHILKKTDKRAKLAEGKAHRKEQGIYYTPTYVVDYIVKNTVGELAKDKTFDLKTIKILDPACGSGSFLMKAFDYLVTLDKKKNGEVDQTKLDLTGASANYGRKVEILKENIFGVDLDSKAVEIAQLNLLLKTTEKKHRLPTLQENIKVGNSLIDDSAIAGDRAFKWEEQFKDIMANGGFDVVIGNPPYGADLEEVKDFLLNKYSTNRGKMNSYRLFIEKGMSLLRNEGVLGFIVPNTWLSDNNSHALREKILKETKIIKILVLPESLKVFEGVTQATTVIILKKDTNSKNVMNNTVILMDDVTKKSDFDSFVTGRIKQKTFFELDNLSIITKDDLVKLVSKIKDKGKDSFENFFTINQGEVNLTVYKKYLRNKSEDKTRPLIRGNDLQRYQIDKQESKESFVVYTSLKRDDSDENRIVLQEVSNMAQKRRIKATILEKGANCGHTCNYLYSLKENTDIFYHLGILNSKLINLYFKVFSNTNHVSGKELRRLPIISCYNKTISNNAKTLIELNRRLIEIKDKQTDEKVRIEKEIQKLDNEIDKEVYKLYGITEEEKKIIEDSLK